MADTSAYRQYLSFIVGEETFAVEIEKVREVLDLIRLTRIPRTPASMSGVISLRGSAVPVFDLRLLFGVSGTERPATPCVIILEVSTAEKTVILGALADSVREVFDLTAEQIEAAPSVGTNINVDFLKGVGKKEDEFVLILDIDRVFSSSDMIMASDAAAQTIHENQMAGAS